jgi:predicted ATPase
VTSAACACEARHPPHLVVVTGGPGAGKTALLEVVQRTFCKHVTVLPEVASMLWTGGFPRRDTPLARRAAQRAITHVQLELQRLALEEGNPALIVCDRGTLDGLAYWAGDPAAYFDELRLDHEQELARYAAVIHMCSPSREEGYQPTAMRPETAEQAAILDGRTLAAWAGHPRRFVVRSDGNFIAKLERSLALVRAEVPPCCRG